MKNHPHIYLLFLLLSGSFSCKKFIEKQKENAAVDLITNGTWRVTRYQAGATDFTADFAGYAFQFQEGGGVDGTLGGNTVSGTWSADVNARTITAVFPASDSPVNKLNYTWKITDSYNDSVSARTQTDTALNLLQLHKN